MCEGNVSPQRPSLAEIWRGRAAHVALLVTQTRRLSAPSWLLLPLLLAFMSGSCPQHLVSVPLAFLFLTPLMVSLMGGFKCEATELLLFI